MKTLVISALFNSHSQFYPSDLFGWLVFFCTTSSPKNPCRLCLLNRLQCKETQYIDDFSIIWSNSWNEIPELSSFSSHVRQQSSPSSLLGVCVSRDWPSVSYMSPSYLGTVYFHVMGNVLGLTDSTYRHNHHYQKNNHTFVYWNDINNFTLVCRLKSQRF